jgi:predicted Zn-dependent protease
MKQHLRQQFDEAVKAQDAGELLRARGLLVHLHEDDPGSAAILAVLGDVCWELSRFEEAIDVFRRATTLKPGLEAASLGLFHCLWKVGRKDEAFDEMRRFLSIYESDEYTRVLADLMRV